MHNGRASYGFPQLNEWREEYEELKIYMKIQTKRKKEPYLTEESDWMRKSSFCGLTLPPSEMRENSIGENIAQNQLKVQGPQDDG